MNTEQLIALHEAGHIAATIELGHSFMIGIATDDGGQMRFDLGADREITVNDRSAVGMAGAVAVRRVDPNHSAAKPSASDLKQVPASLLDFATAKADELLSRNWPGVLRLADHLYKRNIINPAEARDIYFTAPSAESSGAFDVAMAFDMLAAADDHDKLVESVRKRFNVPAKQEVIVKTVGTEIDAPEGKYRCRARITTDSLDRSSEVIIPQGIISTDFDKSGCIFYCHDYLLPVAKPIGKLTRGRNYIDGDCEFAKRPADYVGEFFPDFVRALVQQRVIRGVSIGFIPLEARNPTPQDRKRWGDSIRRVISKSTLLEWSFAPLQSNPDAVITEAVSKGIISPDRKRFTYAEPATKPKAGAPLLVKKKVYIIPSRPAITEKDISRIAGETVQKLRGRIYYKD